MAARRGRAASRLESYENNRLRCFKLKFVPNIVPRKIYFFEVIKSGIVPVAWLEKRPSQHLVRPVSSCFH